MLSSSQVAALDSDELARFREEWREEVRKKRGLSKSSADSHVSGTSRLESSPAAAEDIQHPASPAFSRSLVTPVSPDLVLSSTSSARPATDLSLAPYGKTLSRAVEVYRRAIQCEQQSRLDEALELYRTAFRLDSNVDRAYNKLEVQLQHTAGPSGVPTQAQGRASTTSASEVDEITQAVKALDMHSVVIPDTQKGNSGTIWTLASQLASWPRPLVFEPEDERASVPLQKLPDELLVLVLRCLDTTTLERFAMVNRKARVVTLDKEIWRGFVRAIYKPPQIPIDQDLNSLLHYYTADFRRLYIEHPRIRLDGVYIAVCHYIRAGLSENAWVNISHLITYHRYLRFYPNGRVLSLLANEGMSPQQVIPVLKPTLRMKGFFIGNWELVDNTVHITSLLDPTAGSQMKYAFKMTLDLRSRPLGRWNKLDFRAYDSVEIESGEATPVPLKHERSFWFSKVKSYA